MLEKNTEKNNAFGLEMSLDNITQIALNFVVLSRQELLHFHFHHLKLAARSLNGCDFFVRQMEDFNYI